MTALIILGSLAALGMAGLTVAVVVLCRSNSRMGDKLIANSDHQLERIKYETGAEAARHEEQRPRPSAFLNGYADPPEDGAMDIPMRG